MRALIPAAAVAALVAGSVFAGEHAEGRQLYLDACATCHGAEAAGNGPMTQILTLPVPDLTGLADRNGGVFPWLTTVHMIDGRTGLHGHGGAMPIFGALMRGDTVAADAPDGTPVMVSARVLALVDYLATIQD
ncbi:MAG: cytochrome c [Rhodobacteraceae bacterium]|nr:cytochrome c [Paracoccaceae bacterium]